jgi:MFS family permease
LASFAVSSIGDFFYFVAIVVFLLERTGSASWLAAAVVARLLAYALFGSFGGVMADRYDRRRLMVLLDFVRAGVMVILAVVAWEHGPPALVIGLTVVNAIASCPYRPALVASTPALVHEDDLAAANAAESVVGQIAYFLGPALGGLLVAIAGTGAAFIVNAASFGVSGLFLSRLGGLGGGATNGTAAEKRSARADLVEGMRTVRTEQGLAALIAFTAMVAFLFGFEQVVHVLVATDRLGMSAAGVGLLSGAIGVGGILIAPFTARLGDGPSAGTLLAAAGVIMGVPLALLAVIGSPAVAATVLLAEGAGSIAFEVLFITLLQRATPEHLLARVYGLQDSLTSVAQLFGALLAPVLIGGVELDATLWIGGAIVVGVAVVLLPPLTRLSTRTDAQRRRVAPTVAFLRKLRIFADAPHAALERMARAASTRTTSAGADVFAENDEADDLFVIVAGVASVHRAGAGELARLGPGDWFGEVGLIQRRRRNATVTAIDNLELLAISGHIFLDSLTSTEILPDPLRLSLAARSTAPPPEPVRATS